MEEEKEEDGEKYIEVSADTNQGYHTKERVICVLRRTSRGNYYEIMISNIAQNKDDAHVFKAYNFRCEKFKDFFSKYDYSI